MISLVFNIQRDIIFFSCTNTHFRILKLKVDTFVWYE